MTDASADLPPDQPRAEIASAESGRPDESKPEPAADAPADRPGPKPRTLVLLPNPPRVEPEPKIEHPAAGFRQRHALMRHTLVTTAAAALLAVFFAAGTLLAGRGHDSGRSVTVATAGDVTPPTGPAALPGPPPPTPQEEANRRIADLTAQIRGLSDSVDALRGRMDKMRAGSETLGTTVASLRADLDRNRAGDDLRAMKKSVDALRQGLDQAKADSAAALAQMAQKLDRADRDSGQKTATGVDADDLRALKKSVDALKDGLGQAKTDSAAALAQIAQRLDRVEHEPTAKVAQVSDRLDRSERRTVVPADATGSISPRSATALPPKPAAIPGFAVRDVSDGAALIEGRNGLFEISPGDSIPGVGLVQSIERRGRGWAVITSRGVISSAQP